VLRTVTGRGLRPGLDVGHALIHTLIGALAEAEPTGQLLPPALVVCASSAGHAPTA